jgi:tricorn protease
MVKPLTCSVFLISLVLLGARGAEGPAAESYDRIYLASRPTLSPDGRQFAFEWCDGLWLAPVAGGAAEPLQVTASKDLWPVFSPDGKRLAFQSDRDGGLKIFELNLSDGQTRQVVFHSEGARPYGWTADGRALVATVARDHDGVGSPERIALLPAAERGAEAVLFDTYGSEPCLSPDGAKLLFTREGDDLYRLRYRGSRAAQIWLYELKEKRFTCLVKRETESRTPLWAPDGKSFYYVSGEGGAMNVWRRELEGGKEAQVTFFKSDSVIHPALSRDGRTLVFRHLFDFYRMDPAKPSRAPEKILLQPGAASLRPASRRRYYNACWNNDVSGDVSFCDNGMQIAFTTGGDLWVMDTVLRDPKLVHGSALTHERECVFAPDGQALYYLSDRGDGTALWRVCRGDPSKYWWENASFPGRALLSDGVARRALSVSPAGDRLAWVEPTGNIVIADTNGVVTARCRPASGVDAYDWSPDGKWLVASIADDYSNYDVWILPTDGKAVPYNLSRHFSWDGQPKWSPDGKLIAFVGQRPPNGEASLFYVWLSRADEERNTLDKKLDEARSAMRRERGGDKKEEGSKPPAAKADAPIDFDDLHLRVRRVDLPDAAPSSPFFSHDSRTLAFDARVRGQHGTYKIVLPDRLAPELLTQRRGRAVAWLAKDNRLLWLSDNLPAHMDKTFPFSAYQETGMADYQELGFLTAWGKLRDWYYDAGYHGADWSALKEKYRLAARNARSHSVFTRVLSLLLGELNSSHLGFNPSDASKREWDKAASFQSWSTVTAHLGLRFDPAHEGRGWKVLSLIEDGPADLVTLDLKPGDLVVAVDGAAVSPTTDPAQVLNGPENRRIELTVQSGTNAARAVAIQSSTFAAIREKQKTADFEAARKRVHGEGGGKLGYLNIQRMNWDDYYRFEQEIFAEGFDKDGMVIDVRDNTGGFVADRILSVLCGSVHSIAVARDAAPAYLSGYWGRPVWDKPVVVLCNQNTASNGEIFTHAIKTLKRGKVVGVPTGGAVIATSDTPLLDLGTLRLPHRGWFLPDGTDMELHGTQPDVVVWHDPADLVAGQDRQLEAAIRLLKDEVAAEKQKAPTVKLQYAR